MKDGKLERCCLVTDGKKDPSTLVSVLAEALRGGIRFIQLREKQLSSRSLHELARELQAMVAEHRGTLVINDRIDICLAVGARGVHLGAHSVSIAVARRILGKSALIGVSTHSIEEARRAEGSGADYVTYGPVYETGSKKGILLPRGTEALREIRSLIRTPILALGGIRPGNAPEVIQTGVHGIAFMSAIMSSADPTVAARSLVRIVESHRR